MDDNVKINAKHSVRERIVQECPPCPQPTKCSCAKCSGNTSSDEDAWKAFWCGTFCLTVFITIILGVLMRIGVLREIRGDQAPAWWMIIGFSAFVSFIFCACSGSGKGK